VEGSFRTQLEEIQKADILIGVPSYNQGSGVESLRAVAQTHRLPFDRLRANRGVLRSCDLSVHAELVEA